MRVSLSFLFACAVGTLGAPLVAQAQGYPYDTATPIAPYAPPASPAPVAPAQYEAAPQYAPPAAPQMPPVYAPPGYYPAPGEYPPPGYYQPPGYYYPPAAPVYRPPVYVPPARRVRPPRNHLAPAKPPRPEDRARFFSIGGRGTVLGIGQKIGDDRVTLGGGGLELRFRTRGHFGMETSIDFLHANFTLNGPVERESIPFQVSALVYVLPNRDAHRFNIYFLGGLGFVSTTMTLTDPTGASVKQDFTEYEAHLGAGAELRFKWFALRADVRGLELWRDNNKGAAPFYAGVDGAPVPEKSYAVMGTFGVALWF